MAKLGTKKKPAVVRVGSEARALEIMRICNENGWQVIVGIEPDEPENIADVKWLLNRGKREPIIYNPAPSRVGPNDYCPCGSGLKYKNCCLNRQEDAKKEVG
jgi:SWIM/SEC-C metal-binding protein